MHGVLGRVSVVRVDAQGAVRVGVGCDSQTSACGCGGGSAEFAPERVGCLSHRLRMTAAAGTTISMRGRCVCMRLCVCFCYCSGSCMRVCYFSLDRPSTRQIHRSDGQAPQLLTQNRLGRIERVPMGMIGSSSTTGAPSRFRCPCTQYLPN